MTDFIIKLIETTVKMTALYHTDKEKFDKEMSRGGCFLVIISIIPTILGLALVGSLVYIVFAVSFESIADGSATFTDFWIAIITPILFVVTIIWTYFHNKNKKGFVTLGDYVKGIFIMWFFPFFALFWVIKKLTTR